MDSSAYRLRPLAQQLRDQRLRLRPSWENQARNDARQSMRDTGFRVEYERDRLQPWWKTLFSPSSLIPGIVGSLPAIGATFSKRKKRFREDDTPNLIDLPARRPRSFQVMDRRDRRFQVPERRERGFRIPAEARSIPRRPRDFRPVATKKFIPWETYTVNGKVYTKGNYFQLTELQKQWLDLRAKFDAKARNYNGFEAFQKADPEGYAIRYDMEANERAQQEIRARIRTEGDGTGRWVDGPSGNIDPGRGKGGDDPNGPGQPSGRSTANKIRSKIFYERVN